MIFEVAPDRGGKAGACRARCAAHEFELAERDRLCLVRRPILPELNGVELRIERLPNVLAGVGVQPSGAMPCPGLAVWRKQDDSAMSLPFPSFSKRPIGHRCYFTGLAAATNA